MPRIIVQEPGKAPQPYRFDLQTPSVHLGRAEENEIVFECGSTSGRHAVMMRIPGGFELRDLGSTNGIRKEDCEVQTCFLNDGERLMLGDVEFAFELLDGEGAALANEVPGAGSAFAAASDGGGVEMSLEPDHARPEATARGGRIATGGVPRWCVVVSFVVLGSGAFFLGASLRHKNATGTSYVERIMNHLRTPDINRIRDLTGEDPEEVFVDRTAEPEVPVTVVEELPEEMQGWEDRDRREGGGADSGYAGAFGHASGGGEDAGEAETDRDGEPRDEAGDGRSESVRDSGDE